MNGVPSETEFKHGAKRVRIPLPLKISLVTFLLMWACTEAVFRLIGFDFDGGEWNYAQAPIYYQQARVPYDTVFFRRPGPNSWTGKVLQTGLRQLDPTLTAYRDERPVTVTYDQDGFRNPPDLRDWDVALVGDSFVELGYLPFEDLISTEIGHLTGLRVRNLGISHTGPMSYLAQLRNFGKAPSCKTAIMVFFEGNDFGDLKTEMSALREFQKTGKRPYRNVEKQTSLTMAAGKTIGCLASWLFPTAPVHSLINADFHSANGPIPVTVSEKPATLDTLPVEEQTDLRNAFKEWSTLAREMGMDPWVVLMPCKPRVLFPALTIRSNASRATLHWRPNNLPAQLRDLAESQGNRVIDLIPDFEAETERGHLTFNTVYDTHLKREGSLLAAKRIAQSLTGSTNASKRQFTQAH